MCIIIEARVKSPLMSESDLEKQNPSQKYKVCSFGATQTFPFQKVAGSVKFHLKKLNILKVIYFYQISE